MVPLVTELFKKNYADRWLFLDLCIIYITSEE